MAKSAKRRRNKPLSQHNRAKKKGKRRQRVKKRISQYVARKIGNALKVNWGKVDIKQFRMGVEVELEHRDVTHGNLKMTGKIA